MSASDRQYLAAHGAGYLTCPSSGPSARVATAAAWTDRGCGFRGSGTDPDRCLDASRSAPGFTGAMKGIQQIMSATGPFRSCTPSAFRRLWSKIPARWLALHGAFGRLSPERAPPASGDPDGHRLPSCPAARYVKTERPSSRLVRHVRGSIRQRECGKCGTGAGCGEENEEGFGQGIGIVKCGADVYAPWFPYIPSCRT